MFVKVIIKKKAKNAVVRIALNKYAQYSLEHKVGVCCNILRRIGSVIGKRVSWREPSFPSPFNISSTQNTLVGVVHPSQTMTITQCRDIRVHSGGRIFVLKHVRYKYQSRLKYRTSKLAIKFPGPTISRD